MPRMRPSHLLLSQQQPQPVKGFDSSLTPGGRVQLAAPGMSGVFSSGQQSLVCLMMTMMLDCKMTNFVKQIFNVGFDINYSFIESRL